MLFVFPLVNMEMEAFEQTLSLQKDGDGGFCKNSSYGTVAYNFIKRKSKVGYNYPASFCVRCKTVLV